MLIARCLVRSPRRFGDSSFARSESSAEMGHDIFSCRFTLDGIWFVTMTRPNKSMHTISHLLAMGWLFFLTGCAFDSSSGNSTVAPGAFTEPKAHLTPTMSDDAILRSLNYEPTRMKVRSTNGMDGYSTTYITRGREVTITRSIVSGVIVMEDVPSGSRSWELGQP